MANRILLCPDNCDPRVYPFGFLLTGMDAPMPWKLAVRCLNIQSGFGYWPEYWDLESTVTPDTTDNLNWEKIVADPSGNLIVTISMTNTGRLFNLFGQEECRNLVTIQATDLVGANVGTWSGIKPVVKPDTLGDVVALDWTFPGSQPVFLDLAWRPMKWDDTDASIYF